MLLDLHNDRLINSNGLFNNNFWEYFDSYDRSFKRFLHDGRNIHQLRFFWNDRNFRRETGLEEHKEGNDK